MALFRSIPLILFILATVTEGAGSSGGEVISAAVGLARQELAAERPVPRQTDATRNRVHSTLPERAGRPERPEPLRPEVLAVPRTQAARSEPVAETPEPQPTSVAAPIRPTADEAESVIVVPSQGRPVIVTPGDTFFFVLRLRRSLGDRIVCRLVHSLVPEVACPLKADVKLGIVQGRYGQMILQVPWEATPGLYDLEVQGQDRNHISRQSVKVVEQFGDSLRIVHLSNMNIGDPAAPEFDELLVDEINLLAPDFVVCTGDLTEWGRALADPNDWLRSLSFLGRIHAPAYIVCGDHDDEASFDRYVADNPMGTMDYGHYHGILMLDHSAHRLDSEQVKWLIEDLDAHRDVRGFNFILMHNDELDVLDMLRREVKELPGFIRDHKLRMIITGGHIDWDLREFAGKLKGLEGPGGLIYIRTHQSSTCMHDRATGVSHYRVIDVNGQEIDYIYPDDTATTNAQHSVPVGRLRVFYNRPNDGSQEQVVATVQNALNRVFENCRIWLRVAKKGGASPVVAGGQLVRVLDGKTYWMCEVRVDLPDKGGLKVMAANDPSSIPPPVPVTVTVAAEAATQPTTTRQASSTLLTFSHQHADAGLSYYRCVQRLSLVLMNTTSEPQEVWPVVRLNGEVVPLDFVASERRPLRIEAGRQIALPLPLVLGRFSPGLHQLQVFFRSDPLKRVTVFPVSLRLAGS